MTTRIGVVGLCLALGLSGCTSELTQLLVSVDTDLPLQLVSIEVSAEDAIEAPDVRELSGPFPLSFGVLAPQGDPSRRVRISIEGRAEGLVSIRTTRVAPFLANRTAHLQIFLARVCRNVSCDIEETCDQGTCRPEFVAPEELQPVLPGEEFRDAGAQGPTLRVQPASVDFGQLSSNINRPLSFIGQATQQILRLEYDGIAAPLSAQFTGADATQFRLLEPNVEPLRPGQEGMLTIIYQPQQTGAHQAQLILEAGGATARVPLTGQAEACPSGPNTQALADPDGTCRLICADGFRDADHDPTTGCECAVQSDEDLPDPQFRDSNCDGIDGDLAAAVFLAPPPLGDDTHRGTRDAPVATFAQAMALATSELRPVYVSVGTYRENVAVPGGISVYGGYDADRDWVRSEDIMPSIEAIASAVVVQGPQPVVLSRLRIVAQTAPTGEASVALTAVAADLRLTHCELHAETGSRGAPGAVAQVGLPGIDGRAGTAGTTNASTGGLSGSGGQGLCGDDGGAGGSGGYGLGEGFLGDDARAALGGFGGLAAGSCTACDVFCGSVLFSEPGEDGQRGDRGATGDDAPGVSSPPIWTGSRLQAASGLDGLAGGPGQPGAGGGGGGGGPGQCLIEDTRGCFREFPTPCQPDRGGGGGGGGSAGCPGQGGRGGRGGGASLGLLAVQSSIRIEDVQITVADGGPGGEGSPGGEGGRGGLGGLGGAFADDSGPGGRGGSGGTAGSGGRGGGGAGGPAYCIYRVQDSPVSTESFSCTVGSGGPGGAGSVAGTQGGTGQIF